MKMILKNVLVSLGQVTILAILVMSFFFAVVTFSKKPEVKYDSSVQLEYNQKLDRMEVPMEAIISVTAPNGTSVPREHWENLLRNRGYTPTPVTISEEER